MDKLVDSIVGQVLGKAAPAEDAGLNRPNYQRQARPCSMPESTPAAVPPVGSGQSAPQIKNAGRVPPPFPPEKTGCGRGCAACKGCCRDLEPGQALPDLTLDTDQALRWLRLQNGGMGE